MARRTKQEAEETREKVMTAALNLIYEKGYARSTFVDIAKSIELSKGAVYWHFKNKADLFLALGKNAEDRINSLMTPLVEKTDTLPELEHALCEMILLMSGDELLRKYYTIVYYRMEWTKELLSIKVFFNEQDRMMVDWIAGILESEQIKNGIAAYGTDTLTLAKALYGVVGGLLAYALSERNEAQVRKKTVSNVIQMGLNVFFRGMIDPKE